MESGKYGEKSEREVSWKKECLNQHGKFQVHLWRAHVWTNVTQSSIAKSLRRLVPGCCTCELAWESYKSFENWTDIETTKGKSRLAVWN